MKRTVAKVTLNGEYTIVHEERAGESYTLYHRTYNAATHKMQKLMRGRYEFFGDALEAIAATAGVVERIGRKPFHDGKEEN